MLADLSLSNSVLLTIVLVLLAVWISLKLLRRR